MKKIIRLTESELTRLVRRVIKEAGPGHPQPKLHPGWNVELSSISKNGIKWNEQKKRYIGQVGNDVYHFFPPNPRNQNQGEFRRVGGSQNSMGLYVIDNSSTTPFVGIKILTNKPVTTHPGQTFV